jgi:phosphoribosyl 1,2-cyclic phosphate phosphodiesterase
MNIRSRSGALLDDDLKIDFGPDTVSQLQRTGRNLSKLKTIIFTHQHTDHFVASELEWLLEGFTKTPPPAPLEVIGNVEVIQEIRRASTALHFPRLLDVLALREVKAGDQLTTAAGDALWIMPADHCEHATVFRLRRGSKTIFYGHDSGIYPPQTMERLCDGIPLDLALLDCTNGGIATKNRGHMGVSGVVQVVSELRRRGAITDHTRTIATHFSHNGGLLHEELVRAFLPHGIEVAFDGMCLKL